MLPIYWILSHIFIFLVIVVTCSKFDDFYNFNLNNNDSAISLAVFGQSLSQNDLNTLAGFYNSTQMGISIYYPVSWKIYEDITNYTTTFYPPKSNSSVQIKILPSYDINLKKWSGLLKNLHTKLGHYFREEDSSLTNYTDYSISYSNYSYGHWNNFMDTIILDKHMLVYINTTNSEDQKYSFDKITQDMLKSFKINKNIKLINQSLDLTINKIIEVNSGFIAAALLETFDQSSSIDSAKLSHYNNSQMGISFDYSSNWHIDDQQNNTVILYPSNTFDDNVQIKILPSYNKGLREWINLLKKNLLDINATNIIEKNSIVTKYPSREISYSALPERSGNQFLFHYYNVRDILIVTEEKVIFVSLRVGSSIYPPPEFFAAAEKILHSLTLTNVPERRNNQNDMQIDKINKIDKGHLNDTYSDHLQIITSEDGKYVYVAWEDYNNDIIFTRSTNHGINFQEPVILNNYTRSNVESSLHMVQYNNNVHLVWNDGDSLSYAKSNDNGLTFSKNQFFTENINNEISNPSIALFKENVYVIALQKNMTNEGYEKHNSYLFFLHSTNNGKTFEKKVIYYDSDLVEFVPTIITSYNGTLYVSWINDDTGEVYFSKSTDSGSTFTYPINLFDGNCSYRLGLFSDKSNVYVTCIESVGPNSAIFLFTRSINSGNTFDKIYSFGSIDDPPLIGSYPIFAGSNYTLFLTWGGAQFINNIQEENPQSTNSYDIYLTKSDDYGSSFYPIDNVTPDIDGSVHLLDVKTFNNKVYILYNSDFLDSDLSFFNGFGDLILATSTNYGKTFEKKLILNEYGEPSKDAKLSVANNGTNIYVVWENQGISKRGFSTKSIDIAIVLDNNITKLYNNNILKNGNKNDIVMNESVSKNTIKYCLLNNVNINMYDILPLISPTNLNSSASAEEIHYSKKLMEFYYPKEWDIDNEANTGRDEIVKFRISDGESLRISAGLYSPSNMEINRFIKNYNISEIFFDHIKKIQYSSTILDHHPAIQIEAVGEVSGISENTKLIDIFTVVNNTLYDIRYIGEACKDDFEDTQSSDNVSYLPTCDQQNIYSNQNILPNDIHRLLFSFKILSSLEGNNEGQTINFLSRNDNLSCN